METGERSEAPVLERECVWESLPWLEYFSDMLGTPVVSEVEISGKSEPVETREGEEPVDGTPQNNHVPAAPSSKARALKTPLQRDALEAAYKVKKFPDEAIRRALGERLNLTEHQVGIWFAHRRKKDRQAEAKKNKEAKEDEKSQADITEPPPAQDNQNHVPQNGAAQERQNGLPENPANFPSEEPQGKISLEMPPPSIPYRGNEMTPAETSPTVILSKPISQLMQFMKEQACNFTELPENIRSRLPEVLVIAREQMADSFLENGPSLVAEFDVPPVIRPDGTYADEHSTPMKRKRVDGDDEDWIARKKRTSMGGKGPPRNDAEKAERANKRAEEKAERDKKKIEIAQEKEEKRQRLAQEREEKKQQLQAAKEERAQKRKDALDERRKEKEVLKAQQAQERQAVRLRQKEIGFGPRDDLDLEWEALLAAQQEKGYASGTEEGSRSEEAEPIRPEFPPPNLGYVPLFPEELPEDLGSNILCGWNFLNKFRDLLGVPFMTFDDLLQALIDGDKSCALAELHMSMMRVVQADMEEAHATGAMQSGATINFLDKAIVNCASMLEEAWKWGFDVDVWRAHLNYATWPEILRQLAILWGLGPKRPKPKRELRPKMGTEGEDLKADEQGGLKLRLPPRLGIGTVKAAAWQILADEGPMGLPIPEIARRIQQSGLRDLRTTKTPEASVAGAIARDVVFQRVAPSTFALHSIVKHQGKLALGDGQNPNGGGAQNQPNGTSDPNQKENKDGEEEEDDHDEEGDSSGDEDEDHHRDSKGDVHEPWVQSLLTKDYTELPLSDRVSILVFLVNLTTECPTIRNTLEHWQDEAAKVRKAMWEEARSDKKKRTEEAALKAKKEEEEAAEKARVEEAEAKKQENKEGGASARATPEPAGNDQEKPVENENPQNPTEKENEKVVQADPAENLANPKPAEEIEIPETASKPKDETVHQPQGEEGDKDQKPPEKGEEAANNKKEETSNDNAVLSAAAADRARKFKRAETIRKAEEKYATRAEPLGLDRRHNKYWRFIDEEDRIRDSFAGRLVVESSIDGSHRIITSPEGVKGLINALDKRGAREGPLFTNLTRHQAAITGAMPSTTIRYPRLHTQEEASLLDKEQARRIGNLPCAALDYRNSSLGTSLPMDASLSKCKRDLLAIERKVPVDSLIDSWATQIWQEKVNRADSIETVKKVLAEFEQAFIGFVAAQFSTDRVFVPAAWKPTEHEQDNKGQENPNSNLANGQTSTPSAQKANPNAPSPNLEWLPDTSAALLLRIQALDAAIVYDPKNPAAREILSAYRYTIRPAPLRCKIDSNQNKEETLTQNKEIKEEAQAIAEANAQQNSNGEVDDRLAQIKQRLEPKLELLTGQPVGIGGRALPSLMPPFPTAFNVGKRKTFTLNWQKLRKEIEDEKAGILPAPVPIQRPPPGKRKAKGGANKGNAKNKGKGKSNKGKGKGKSSALREEFDRQSEEEEAAERRAFSTPGFSDDDSEGGLVFKRSKYEDLEISD